MKGQSGTRVIIIGVIGILLPLVVLTEKVLSKLSYATRYIVKLHKQFSKKCNVKVTKFY